MEKLYPDLISIIIPVYNVEQYLAQCLQSVTAQTYKNIEIILINDGSKDESDAICERFAQSDERIRYLLQENKGVSVARNKGIQIASGKYISFIDSDDFIEENFIDALYRCILEKKSTLALCPIRQLIKGKVKKFKNYPAEDDIYNISNDNIAAFLGSVWNFLYEAEFLKSLPEFIEDIYYEDIVFAWIMLTKGAKLAYTDQTSYIYRRDNQDSITKQKSDKHQDYLYAYEVIKGYLKNQGIWDKYKYVWLNRGFSQAFSLIRRVCDKEAMIKKIIIFVKEDHFSEDKINLEPLLQRYYQRIQDGYSPAQLLKYIQKEKTKRKIYTLFGLLNIQERKKRNIIDYES